MAVFLNEAQAGCDQTLIGFPHLLLCMGVVLQTNDWLYGYHFDAPSATAAHATAFTAFIANRGGNVANGVRLYGCANWTSRYGGNGRQAWKTEMQAIATALGYHGTACGFDTGIIAPRDGTYVEFRPDYAQHKCHIYYKRNEKVDYTTAAVTVIPTTNVASFKRDRTTQQMVPSTGYVNYTTGADIQVTKSNKGQLHELNYFLRLVSFTV
jgi:hypothetical protein